MGARRNAGRDAEQAVQAVVDDGPGLLDRGLSGEVARAQARRTWPGACASGPVPVGNHVTVGLAARSWAATTSITAAEFLTRGAIASAGSVSESAK